MRMVTPVRTEWSPNRGVVWSPLRGNVRGPLRGSMWSPLRGSESSALRAASSWSSSSDNDVISDAGQPGTSRTLVQAGYHKEPVRKNIQQCTYAKHYVLKTHREASRWQQLNTGSGLGVTSVAAWLGTIVQP